MLFGPGREIFKTLKFEKLTNKILENTLSKRISPRYHSLYLIQVALGKQKEKPVHQNTAVYRRERRRRILPARKLRRMSKPLVPKQKLRSDWLIAMKSCDEIERKNSEF